MREGLMLSDAAITRTGFRLLSYLYAEYEWSGLRRDDNHDVIDEFIAESDDRISEELVSLAAMARASDDELATLSNLASAFPNGVGKLTTGSDVAVLSPREACNKVLHARKLSYRLETSTTNPLYEAYYQSQGISVQGNYKNPILLLEGEQHRKPWLAEIFAVPFVIATSGPGVHRWRFA